MLATTSLRLPDGDGGALTIRSHRSRVRIPYDSILYTEASGHNQNIFLEPGAIAEWE